MWDVCTNARILRETKCQLRNRQSKRSAKGNLEERPHESDSNHHEGVALSESSSVCPHTVPFSLLINMCFIVFHLWANSFLQSWRARALSLAISLVTRIWHSHYHGWPQSLVGDQNLASRHCRPRPSDISVPLYRCTSLPFQQLKAI